jgi:hypothetical protein
MLGGVFGLETPGSAKERFFHGQNVQYFLSVRCALAALIEARKPKSAWLPSYLCPAILTPFLQRGVEIRYYAVDDQFHLPDEDWTQNIQPGDFVLAIHYFGFPLLSFPAAQATAAGAFLIEDASQALFLRQQYETSGCVLYSPRKFLGVPDGGILVARGETGTESLVLEPPPVAWWESVLDMARRRREFDRTGEANGWFERFQRVEQEFPVGLFRASDLTHEILSSFDFAFVRARRRENFAEMLKLVGHYALFQELDDDVVPLGFPVRVETRLREQVLGRLHAARIYAPVHWVMGGTVPPDALSLSEITLLCDQRCTLRDMEWQASQFLASVEEARESFQETPSNAESPGLEIPALPG